MPRTNRDELRYAFFTTADLNARVDELSAKRAELWDEAEMRMAMTGDASIHDDFLSRCKELGAEISDLLEELIDRDADLRRD